MASAFPNLKHQYTKLLDGEEENKTDNVNEHIDSSEAIVSRELPKGSTSGEVPGGLQVTDHQSKVISWCRRLASPSPERPSAVSRSKRLGRKATSTCCRTVGTVVFVIVLGAYCIVSYFLQPLILRRIREGVIIRPNASNPWEEPRAEIFLNIHIFNLTNPEEALNGEEKFKLQEMGPYVYRIRPRKVDIVWNTNSTVSFREINDVWYEPSLANGDTNDVVSTVDVPFLMVSDMLDKSLIPSWIGDIIKSGDHLFTIRSVEEILWGYQDNILKSVALYIFHLFKGFDDIPSTFGYLMTTNSTPSGLYNIYTGQNNYSRLNEIYTYDYQRYLNNSEDDDPQPIHGSLNGIIFPPPVHKKSSLVLFFAFLLKSFLLKFSQTSSYKGVDTYRFQVLDSQYSLRVEDESSPTGFKLLKGISDMEPVNRGAPLFLSFPHFLGADEELHHRIEGLHPNETLHRTYLDNDPLTGATPHVRQRYQINARLDLDKFSKNGSDKSSIYLPLMWIDINGHADQQSLDELLKVAHIVKIVDYVLWGVLCLLCVVALIILIQLLLGMYQHSTDKNSTFISTSI